MALDLSSSNIFAKKIRSSNWADLRKSQPKAYEVVMKEAFACVVKDRATYC
jgi:hypothetical protein